MLLLLFDCGSSEFFLFIGVRKSEIMAKRARVDIAGVGWFGGEVAYSH